MVTLAIGKWLRLHTDLQFTHHHDTLRPMRFIYALTDIVFIKLFMSVTCAIASLQHIRQQSLMQTCMPTKSTVLPMIILQKNIRCRVIHATPRSTA